MRKPCRSSLFAFRAFSALAVGLWAIPAAAAPLKVVAVSAPDINCRFDPSCTVVVNDTVTPIPLAGTAGTAFLQSRNFQSTPGSPGAGRYVYEYRIDLRGASGTDGPVCITSLSLSFGSPGLLDLDGDGGGDQVFVITQGGLGSVGPAWVDQSKKIVTFFFQPAVCTGAGSEGGQSTYFIGLTSSYKPKSVGATVKAQSQPISSLAAVGPKHPVLQLPGAPRSGHIPSACGQDPVSSPFLLDCWLNSFPKVAQAIRWQISQGSGVVPWSSWSESRRAQLRLAFHHAWFWLEDGMTAFGGTPMAEPPVNQELLADEATFKTVLDESTAWSLYLAQVAQSLAVELRGWVPWSLRGYDSATVAVLLSGDKQFILDDDTPGSPNNTVFPGYLVKGEGGGWVTPAHPTFTLTFLKDQLLVANTTHQSIARLLDWSRGNLLHFAGDTTVGNFEGHWQYRGAPPVSRIISGTSALTTPGLPPQFGHWTAGCHGTTDFLKSVLRAVNIPVFKHSLLATNHSTCGHATPYFPSVARYLSHGDDPYTGYSKGHPLFPAALLLIDQQQYDTWFMMGQDTCPNVGRRPPELLVQFLSNELVDMYCADVAAGKTHATGSVFAFLEPYYTVPQLEATGLWLRLSQRAQALGKCDLPPGP